MLINDGFMHIFDKFSTEKQKNFRDITKRMIIWPEFIQIGIVNFMILKKSENKHTYGYNVAKVETRMNITNIKKEHCP